MSCLEFCGGAHTAQRQTSIQTPIGFSANLLVSVTVSVSVAVSGSVKAPLRMFTFPLSRIFKSLK